MLDSTRAIRKSGTRVKMIRTNEVFVHPDGMHTEVVKRRITIESNDLDSNMAWDGLFDSIADTVKLQINNP